MKKNISYLFVAVFAVLFSANAFALSLIYEDAFECRDDPLPHGARNAISTSVGITSEFKIVAELGGGLYLFELAGGLPRILRGSSDVCIESEDAFGHETTVNSTPVRDEKGRFIVIPERIFSTEAVGYFDGSQLVININSIHSSESPQVDIQGHVIASIIRPNSFILIFEFNPDKASFKLIKYWRNRGVITVRGGHESTFNPDDPLQDLLPDGYFEHMEPTLTREFATPIPDIEYRIVE